MTEMEDTLSHIRNQASSLFKSATNGRKPRYCDTKYYHRQMKKMKRQVGIRK